MGGGVNVLLKFMLVTSGRLTSETAIFTTAIAEIILIFIEIGTIKKEKVDGMQGLMKKYIKYFVFSISFDCFSFLNSNFSPHEQYLLLRKLYSGENMV